MRPEIRRISDNLVFIMPGFIHEYGDSAHHWSMMRTVELDEDEDFIRGTGPSDLRFWLHELLDDYFFYPAQRWLLDWMGDSKIERFFRRVLGFFWGVNCGFPLRDVALYTVWSLRGCKARAVFKKRGETWVKTYPEEKEARALGGHQEATGRGLRIYATNRAGEAEIPVWPGPPGDLQLRLSVNLRKEKSVMKIII